MADIPNPNNYSYQQVINYLNQNQAAPGLSLENTVLLAGQLENQIRYAPTVSPGMGGNSSTATTTQNVPGGVVVRDANGNIITDTRSIINQTTQAAREAQITGTATQTTPSAAYVQSQQNIQAANMLLPSLYAQAEGRAPLEPGQTYQSVLKQINILEGARQAESKYSGVSATYGYNPESVNRYYEYRAQETARVNPVLAEQYASGKVMVGGTLATYNELATQGTQLDVKPYYQKMYAPLTVAAIREEATRANALYVSTATGIPYTSALENVGYYATPREGGKEVGRLGEFSYTGMAETGISQAKSTGSAFIAGLGYNLKMEAPAPASKNIIYSYEAELLPGLTQEELTAAQAGLSPSTGAAQDLTGYVKKNVGTITITGRENQKAITKQTQPYDIYVKEAPAPAQNNAVNIKSIYRTPENKYSQIDKDVYAAGAFAEDLQAGIEGARINVESTGIFGNWNYSAPNIGDVKNLSQQTSKALSSYAETQAYNPYIPYYLNPVWITAQATAGAAALPSAVIGLPEFSIKTYAAAQGVKTYTDYMKSDIISGKIAEVPTSQAEEIGTRARGALSEYYGALTNPQVIAQTAGMVAVPFAFKAGYGAVRDTVGVPEVSRVVLAEPTIRELPTYTWDANAPIRTKPIETAPGSSYTGLFYVRGTEATPVIGVAEGKPAIGTPKFTVPPERAFNTEIRTEPKATAIVEASTQDYARSMGVPEQAEAYQAYRYAARETYPYTFEPKQRLDSVLKQQPDQFGAVVYEFIKQDTGTMGVKLSEPKGSVAQRVFMGEEMNRLPADVDIRRVNAPEGAKALYEFPATKQYLQETGIKARLDEAGNRIEFYNPKTGEWYHRVEFKEKTGEPSLEGEPGAFNQPEYIGYGLKEKAYQDIGGGIRISQLGEQGARKASSAFTPRETGEFLPEPHRFKDISDATNIFRFVSEEKARPDIYEGIAKVIPKLPKAQQEAAKALLPEEPKLEYAISRKAPATLKEAAIKTGKATAEAGTVYKETKAKAAEVKAYSEPAKAYSYDTYGSPKAYGYGAAMPPYRAPASPSNYKATTPSKYVSASPSNYGGASPNYKAPSSPYRAPASPSNYKAPSPSDYKAPYNYKAPSPSDYKAPSNYKAPYRAPYRAPASPATPKITINRPPPPPTITTPTPQIGGRQVKAMEMEPESTGIKGGKHSLLADLLSVEISRARYGAASSVNPRTDRGIWKYEANTFGYVPTAQLIKGGGNKGRNPMPARVLIPKRKGG